MAAANLALGFLSAAGGGPVHGSDVVRAVENRQDRTLLARRSEYFGPHISDTFDRSRARASPLGDGCRCSPRRGRALPWSPSKASGSPRCNPHPPAFTLERRSGGVINPHCLRFHPPQAARARQTKFYTACLRAGTRWSSTVFAHELSPRAARFEPENCLYSFALTVPSRRSSDHLPLTARANLRSAIPALQFAA